MYQWQQCRREQRQVAPRRSQHPTVYVQDIRDLASSRGHGDRAIRHVKSYRMNSIRPKRKQRQREHTKQWETGKAPSRCRPNWSCVLYHSHAKLMPIRPKDTKRTALLTAMTLPAQQNNTRYWKAKAAYSGTRAGHLAVKAQEGDNETPWRLYKTSKLTKLKGGEVVIQVTGTRWN